MALAYPAQFVLAAASYFLEGISRPRRVMAVNLIMLPLNALLAWATPAAATDPSLLSQAMPQTDPDPGTTAQTAAQPLASSESAPGEEQIVARIYDAVMERRLPPGARTGRDSQRTDLAAGHADLPARRAVALLLQLVRAAAARPAGRPLRGQIPRREHRLRRGGLRRSRSTGSGGSILPATTRAAPSGCATSTSPSAACWGTRCCGGSGARGRRSTSSGSRAARSG